MNSRPLSGWRAEQSAQVHEPNSCTAPQQQTRERAHRRLNKGSCPNNPQALAVSRARQRCSDGEAMRAAPSCRAAEFLPNCRVYQTAEFTKLPSCEVAKLPSYRTTEFPGCGDCADSGRLQGRQRSARTSWLLARGSAAASTRRWCAAERGRLLPHAPLRGPHRRLPAGHRTCCAAHPRVRHPRVRHPRVAFRSGHLSVERRFP